MALDPVTLEVLKNHARAAAESMAYSLYRTAHSTFVKETEDFTTGLVTPEGETYATPLELGATWFVNLNYGPVIRAIDTYEEGDICITNDPYSGFVCTHPPDMHIWKPVFHEGRVVSFAVGHIHNTDVGGAVPASLSRSLTEVYQEGIRLPPTKIIEKGQVNQKVLEILLTNVRAPEQNWGDLKAQIAGVNTGERKVKEMVAKFGADNFTQGIRNLLDYAEAQARAIVRSIPDGDYPFADYMDEDAVDGRPCRLKVTACVRGEEIMLDFTGSDPQVESSLNIPTGGDERHVLLLVGLTYVLYSLDRSLFLNSGIARVVRSILPPGTMVNPVFPAAVGMRTLSCNRLHGVTIGAFARAMPERMPGAPGSGGPIMNVNTFDPRTGRRVMAAINPITGGSGGRAMEDGADGSGANQGFLKNTPVEINEAEVPIRILRYGLARDSGGPGKHRGGLATELAFRVHAPSTKITARNRDRTRFTGWGIVGGKAGAPSYFILNPGAANERDLKNTDIVTVGPGDVVAVACGGAGGWGDPLDRDPQAVLLDVQRGFVSLQGARQTYGVVICDGVLGEKETEELRAQMRSDAQLGFFDYGADRTAFEAVWTEANYDALSNELARIPVHWRFYVKHRVFEIIDGCAMEELKGDGSEVRAAAALVHRAFPQLSVPAAE